MKFLIYGDAPHVGTGYGVQVGHLCRKLTEAGHEVAVHCKYGHQHGVRMWPTPHGQVTLYPCGLAQHGLDVLQAHAMHFFAGDPQGGVIIVVTDTWSLLPIAKDLANFRVLAWAPVDHFPCPPEVLRFFHESRATPVAMAKYGCQQFLEAGLGSEYAPLAVDTSVFKPTPAIVINGETVTGRDLFGIPESADFVVTMVAMNKDPFDRKNFNGALRAFGRFWRDHQNAHLHIHSDWRPVMGSGINLKELAKHAAVPPHAISFTESYALFIGLSSEQLAALYTATDVLLAPSKGEGFGVPMVEAQACGAPVIASDFTAQAELVGAGWKVSGQLEFDGHQSASYMIPYTNEVYTALTEAYALRHGGDWAATQRDAIAFASQYDVDAVWGREWAPILANLVDDGPAADKPLMDRIDVIVPYMRPENLVRLRTSLLATDLDRRCKLIIVEDDPAGPVYSYAENVNRALADSDADWVFVAGDDVEFTPGWIEAARELSDRFDVIGTNDSEAGRVRNPEVAAGRHADHFFVRRSYVDDEGASLDGPGKLAPECYVHWFTDREIIELAKARGVFAPCLESRVIHHHPGYDGDEDARQRDLVYRRAFDHSEADHRTWMQRAPIVAGYRRDR